MLANVFIDTNIVVYAHVSTDAEKHKKAVSLLQSDLVDDNIMVSTQVLGEFYAAMTKYKRNHDEIYRFIIEIIRDSNIVEVSVKTVESCLKLKETYGFSYWDSLILAAALSSNCSIIYSEDMQHNQIIEGRLTIINPFIRSSAKAQ
jgi:predicted nucleic acid-binding protein